VAEGGGNGGWDGWREWPAKLWEDKAAVVVRMRSARRRHCLNCVADGWVHVVLYFSELSKLAQTWKLKMDALPNWHGGDGVDLHQLVVYLVHPVGSEWS
jgi:hypothetical protein